MKHIRLFKQLVATAVMAGALGGAHAAASFNLPPSAELFYTIKAQQKGISLTGDSVVNWRSGEGKYSLSSDSRAAILGKILESRSEGTIDTIGLAPAQFVEKRYRKEPTTVTFDRTTNTLSFSGSKQTYPLKGGEQDRSSVQWQLVAMARAQPEKFTPGSEWRFFVAGRKDAANWVFKVVKREQLATGLGQIEALHLVKEPPPDSKDQHVDIWLAPGQEWYPVQLRFSEEDGEFVEQTLSKIVKH